MKKWKSILGGACLLAGVATAQCQSWLTNGLVAYYPFNGNANNEAGASYNGTPNGAQLTTDRFGKPNKSYQFNGVGDYIYVGNNLPDSQEFSLSVWVNIDSDKYSGIFYEAAFFTPGRDTILETWPGTELRGTATKIASPGPGSLNAPGVLQIGVWKHIVWTLRTNGTALYVNGVAMATSTNAANNVAYHSPMYIGAENHGLRVEYFFHGRMDDVRIYNRGLSSNEVAQLYALEGPEPPSISTQPQAISTIGGSATNFSVVATGSAPLKYQWIKDEAVLPGATNASLVFSNLQLFNTGNYSVIITNLTGSVTSSIATLTVSEWVVSTLAGSGVVGLSNGPALQASFNGIDELKVLPNGSMDVLVVDAGNNNVRSISGGLNPEVNVYAGSQNGSAGTALGNPQDVRFNLPLSVAIGPLGEVYVADTFNYRIVKLAAGTASVLAGSGVAGITDGTGTEASFDFPNDLAVDSAGNVFVSEFNHHVIRKITPSGVVTRFAGDGTAGHQDGEGFQARFNKPGALAIDLNDNLYVGEYVGNRVRKITPAGFVTTVAGSGVTGYADGMGTNAQFNTIASVCLDNEGNLYVGDLNRVIRRITPSGLVQTIAGQGGIGFADGLGRSALFRSPSGMGWHPDGSLLVADDSGSERIRRVAKVTGPVAPSLVQQPVSVVTAAGGTVVFKTAATGSWPLSYQWQKDGVNLPGENGPSLLLSNVQPTRIGDYAVIVANGSGSVTSSVASLSIPGVNSGLWQGLVAYYPFNGNANDESGFGNHFNGNPPFSSDRFYQATAAADYNSVSPFSSSSFSLGASGFSVGMWVRIDRPPSQYGERTLIHGSWNYGASDPRTGLFSIAFWDNLRGAISIVDGSNTAREITTATGTFPLNKWFSLICTSDKTNLHMYMNGQLIGSLASTLGNKMSSLSLGGDSSYYFSSGMLDDIRIYNRALSSNEVAQLYALEAPVPPTFTLQPQSVTAVAGSFTSLSVTATGSDALRYQWLKDGVALPGATNATLVFSNLQPANVGDYLAVVSNGGGSVTSSVASLIIPGVNSGLWQGLVAYYPFNGNANDESGFGNDGLVEGASLITNRLGQLNSAYKFNVLGDKITTTSANGFPAGMDDCTVSMWVNTTWDSGTHQVLLCNSGLEQFQIHLGSLQNSETQIGAQAGGTGEGYYTPIIPWSLNQWYQIQVVRLNRTNVLIYRNGIQLSQQNSTVGNEAPTNQRNLIFGYRPYAPHPAQHYGGLDDIRIYNRALSSNEIAQLYASEFPDADKDGLSDYEEINVLHTNPNKRDTDDDGLSDYEEVHARLTNPTVADTDGDGFNDYAEVYTAHDPLLNTDYPAANLSAFTAIELEFVTKVGTTYQLQTSPDLVTWTNFDSAIIGDGNIWKKTYSTRAQPRLYHRVESVP